MARSGEGAPIIVWLRRDLRAADNPALHAAAASGAPVIPLYALDDETPPASRVMGAAARWWLHHSLAALERDLAGLGAPLVLRRGRGADAVTALAAETGARAVYWNRRYEGWAAQADRALKAELRQAGLACESFKAALLFEPWEIKTRAGAPYKVFTAFWRAGRAAAQEIAAPLPRPPRLAPATPPPASEALEDWDLRPRAPDWAAGFSQAWRPGEAGAEAALARFLDQGLAGYKAARDRPDRAATSRLSPHLAHGEISPRRIWAALEARADGEDGEKFRAEIGWREFNHHLLHHFPALHEANVRPQFDAFPWRDDPEGFRRWTRGETGYPMVDAAMRELWTRGWIHNRARMVAASFLTKHLMIDWRAGERWFWDTLVDADAANNPAGWQWVAGAGADAAPYFRIFNPMAQARRFDPEGRYMRHALPELAKLPNDALRAPWTARDSVLAAAGVTLGRDYPAPLVDHGGARARALEAYGRAVKGGRDAMEDRFLGAGR